MLFDCTEVDSKFPMFMLMITVRHTYKDTASHQKVYTVTAKKNGERWTFEGLGAPLKIINDFCNAYAVDREEARKCVHRWADRKEHELNTKELA